MRTLALALILAVSGSALADTYRVLHRRPSALLASIAGAHRGDRIYRIEGSRKGLIPIGVTVVADDAAGTIDVQGSQALVAETKALFGQLDTPQVKVMAHIDVKSKADKYESTTDTQIPNLSSWMLKDETTGLILALRPRINEDGTITGTFDVTGPNAHVTIVVRVKNGKPASFSFGEHGLVSAGEPASKAQRIDNEAPPVEITIRFEVIGLPGEGKIDTKTKAKVAPVRSPISTASRGR